jgi:hypothetical protein
MRINREMLLRLAEEAALRRGKQGQDVICVYLVGSLLRAEPLLGGTTDIDLVVVHEDRPPVEREWAPVSHEVHYDIAHYPRERFEPPRVLRLDPWMGGSLHSGARLLYEPRHWFEFVQAGAAAQFDLPENIAQRAGQLARSARQRWLDLSNGSPAGDIPPLSTFLKSIEEGTNALLCLDGDPLPDRRLFLEAPQRIAGLGYPQVNDGLGELLRWRDEPPGAEKWEQLMGAWRAALGQAYAQRGLPPHLQAARLTYYESAITAAAADAPLQATWLLLRTWMKAQPSDSAPAEAWEGLLGSLGLSSEIPGGALALLDRFLDGVEESLDQWMARNEVTP